MYVNDIIPLAFAGYSPQTCTILSSYFSLVLKSLKWVCFVTKISGSSTTKMCLNQCLMKKMNEKEQSVISDVFLPSKVGTQPMFLCKLKTFLFCWVNFLLMEQQDHFWFFCYGTTFHTVGFFEAFLIFLKQ